MRLLRGLPFCLSLCSIQAAAQQPTVYQTIFTSITTAQASSPVRNIGQTNHLLLVNTVGGGCASISVGLEGSFDNITYLRFGPSAGGILLTNQLVYSKGAFPYIRVNARTVGAGCTVSTSYTGTFSDTAIPGPFNSLSGNNQTFTASGASTILNAPPAATRITVYGITIWNAGAAQNPLTITCGISTGVILNSFPTGTGFSTPNTGQPFFSCVDATALTINLSATGQVNLQVLYQYE